MRILLVVLGILSFIRCEQSDQLIIKNANLINLETGESELVSIFIEDGIIQEITKDNIDKKNVLDLKGSWIMPPLWDMHAHLHDSILGVMDRYRKYGIFGIRDMGVFKNQHPDFMHIYSNNSQLDYLNNNIHAVGFIYNGAECEVEEHYTIESKSDLIKAIEMIKSTNLNFFKIHNCFPINLLDDLMELCKENELKVVGHIPHGIDPLAFTEYNISSIEHMDSFIRGLFSRKESPAKSFKEVVEILDGPYLDSIADNLKRNNIAITPTLVTYETFVKNAPKEQQESGFTILKRLQSYTKRLHEKGVQILIGTDYPLSGLSGGESVMREMELLIESGIEIKHVLAMASVDAAIYLEEPYKIKEGSKANFIVLEENPLSNLSAFRTLKFALINGKIIPIDNSKNE